MDWEPRLRRAISFFGRLVVQVTLSAIENRLGATAAEMAFNAMLSILPAMLVVIAAVRSLPAATTVFVWIASLLPQVMPPTAVKLLEDGLIELSQGPNRQIFSFGIVITLWLASNFLTPVIRALDRAYNVPLAKRRPWWLNRLFAVGLFLGTVVVLILASIVLGVGQSILNWGAVQAGWSMAFIQVWRIILVPLSLSLMVLALAFLYRMAPARQPSLAPVWPGAIAGSMIWLLNAMGFSYYVRQYGQYEIVYGSIGAVIVLLLWLYLSAFGVLLGGEVNAAIHHLRLQVDPDYVAATVTEMTAEEPPSVWNRSFEVNQMSEVNPVSDVNPLSESSQNDSE